MARTDFIEESADARQQGVLAYESRADKAAFFFIAFFMGCIAMGFMVSYMQLFPPMTGRPVGESQVPVSHAAPPVPLSGSELNQLYVDVVEYRMFLYSLKFWWPILTVLGFSLAVAFVMYYVRTSIAEARETIRALAREEIQRDFEQSVKSTREILENAKQKLDDQLSVTEQRLNVFRDELHNRMSTTIARIEESLSVVLWTLAEIPYSGVEKDAASRMRASVLMRQAIGFSEKALKNLDDPKNSSQQVNQESLRRKVCSELAYYYAAEYKLQPQRNESNLEAIRYASLLIDGLENMEKGERKWEQLDNCIYALFTCDLTHSDPTLLRKALYMYGKYRVEIKDYLCRIKIEELTSRKISDLDSFYELHFRAVSAKTPA